MTYLVNDKCIKCKLTDCVDVCPVDCFYEGKNMLVIKPDECIDCGVCEPECPIDAIVSDTDADLYETNLMRRLAGLLYIDNKTMGDIKDKFKKKI